MRRTPLLVLAALALLFAFAEHASRAAGISSIAIPGLPPGGAGLVMLGLLASLWGLRKAPGLKYTFVHSTWWHTASSATTAAIGLVIPVIMKTGLDAGAVASALGAGLVAYLVQDNPSATAIPAVGAALAAARAKKPSLADDVTSKGPRSAGSVRLALLPALVAIGLMLFIAGWAAAGCGATSKQIGQDIGKCATGEIPAAVQSVLPQVTNAIMGSPADWQSEIASLEAQGVDFAVCTIAAVVHDLQKVHGEMTPAAQEALRRGRTYLAAHGVK